MMTGWGQYSLGMMGNMGLSQRWLTWIVPLAILDLVLKGFALWRSARKGENVWFIFLLIVNSLGILPGIYLLTHHETSSKLKK